MNIESFIEEARKVHGGKYDYSKVEYVNKTTKVCIICPIHGEFWQTPSHHLNGCGCKLCSHQSFKDNNLRFIEKARMVHGNKYDYSKVEYVNAHTKVCIICPRHGEFWQLPTNHLSGKGCPKCMAQENSKRLSMSPSIFIEKARMVHGDKYDYSKVDYINNHTKVCIVCPIHGEFWQTPHGHLSGKGCPKCKQSHLEKEVSSFLMNKNIVYENPKRFDWLGRQHLDFYLPEYNVAIECQGEQHFVPANAFNKTKPLDKIISNDEKKCKLCSENNVRLLFYTSERINRLIKDKPEFYEDVLFTDLEILMQKIRGH